jgi:predicted GIY-YIG superfamily endonuclease
MDNSIRKTTLYRYYDEHDRLLYVGITGDNTNRQSQHRRDSFWFGEIRSAVFEHYESRELAAAAEVRAIQDEKPRYNTQHLNSKKVEFDSGELFAKFHLLTLTSGHDLNGRAVEVDADHAQYQKELSAFDLTAEGYSLDECLAMELEHLVWREVGGEVKLPNLDSCELCQKLFQSRWYLDTLEAVEIRTEQSRREFLNANH